MQRVMYNLIENETKTLMLANVKSEYAFALVDPAVPPEVRDTPKRTIMVLVGLVVGGVIGVLLALGRNLLREYRRTARLAAPERA
jgi:LPS O-antigen subunit length determinant protein (WzzB/FepE family)